MRQRGLTLGVALALVLVATLSTVASGDPPRPGTTNSSLSESEAATLWSRQPAAGYVSNDEYRAAYGENRTAIHQVANGTDLTFTEPPSTAKRWTRYAHGEFEPGGPNVSRYPPTANTTNGTYVRDAHATIFAVSPSTRAFISPSDERFYVPTEGRVLGVVDYRIAGAGPGAGAAIEVAGEREVLAHAVTETRLYVDGERVATGPGSHRPNLSYAVESASNLTLEADVGVVVAPTDAGNASEAANATAGRPGVSNRSLAEVANATGGDVVTETVTVPDRRPVELYNLRASLHHAEYPGGETGAAIYQTEPWQGYSLDETGEARVRGVWRFYTARVDSTSVSQSGFRAV